MHRHERAIRILIGCLTLASLSGMTPSRAIAAPGQQSHSQSGAVYVLTNQVRNTVAVFRRNAGGHLTAAGQFLTGGAGNPVAIPPDPPIDPLASQGALILGSRNQFLFAVNAGSNQISVFKVRRSGLQLVDVINSGGVRPISLTLHDNLLYVLNEGSTPNITGFTVGCDGTLTPLPASSRPLIGGAAADPAQVSFNSDGTLLVVTEKLGNRVDTYLMDDNGFPSAPINNASHGTTPFGFSFNEDGFIVVSEAFAAMPNQAAVSSYNTTQAGALSVISGSVHNSQTAACWVVIGNDGRRAMVSNTGSGTISTYDIAEDGTLGIARAVAANTGANSAPRDAALSANGRFLFVQIQGGLSVAIFHVQNNGSFNRVGTIGGLPFGSQGIAAK
jgi:6-phosphogluconolactonase